MTVAGSGSRLAGLLLTAALGAGCAAQAAPIVPTGTPALNPPEPPARVVVPSPEPRPLPLEVELPPAASPAKPVIDRNKTLPVRPTIPPPAEPPVVSAPTPVLRTSADTAEFEKHVRSQLALARADLARVIRRNLGQDARAQYDSAAGFVRQAEQALKVKNLVYAGQLADKAATMAALLRR